MGCFLGCFGFSSKRKRRRKPAYRVQPGDHRLGSYEPLDSASTNLDIKGEPISTDSESSKKPKESFNCKIRKKVSFNLNVQTYEPIPKEDESVDHFWENDDEEEEKKEETSKETAKEGLSEKELASYPSNYRYRNCIDSYDEEDEIAYEESDLDDDEDDNEDFDEDYGSCSDGGCDIDNWRSSQDEFSNTLIKPLSLSSQMRDSLTRENSEDLKSVGMSRNVRDRSQCVHSVLNPVENLSQWKAVKAKGMPQVKRQRKENVALDQEIAVDASLSNWIVSTESITSKKSSFDKTFPWSSRDDMPVLDITNFEV